MTTIHTRSRVGPDGKIVIPVGVEEAGAEVIVTVIPASAPETARAQWLDTLSRTAGSISDPSFTRPEQPTIDPVPSWDE